jgi:DNA-binding transcriptional LysR family regulator
LRVGFTENTSWHGAVPESFRQFRQRQPDAELQLNPLSTMEQIEAVRAGRLDAGFVFNLQKTDPDFDHLPVSLHNLVLAAPKGHPLTKLKGIRLRDIGVTPFVWFPRRESPAYYDRLMQECFRGGLKSPNIVQEGVDEATILSLVLHGVGVAFVTDNARWRCPKGVIILPVTDLVLPFLLSLAWRKNNLSPLLANFVELVRQLPEVKAFAKSRIS